MFSKLSALDLGVFIVFLLATVGVVLVSRFKGVGKTSNARDYILMGRRLTLPLFVATLVSSWYGGIFGVTQIAFEHGIYNFITQGVFWYIAYFIFAFLFIKKLHQQNALTFPELIKQQFGERSAKFAAVLLVFKALPITYAISIGIFLQTLFGLSLEVAIITGSTFVISYTCLSNFKSVVVSDVLQFFMMYIGTALVVIFAFFYVGDFSVLRAELPEHYFRVNGNHSFTTTLLWLFIAFSATLISPVFYQRCMAAKTPAVAKWGIVVSVVFWVLFDVMTTLGGMYARVHLPEVAPLNAYLLFGLEILPPGLKGFFLAGIVATIISTLDSFIFVTSTIFSYDLMKKQFHNSNSVRILSVIFTGILTVLVALMFQGKIENVWLVLEGYFGAVLIIPIIWSYCIKTKIGDKAFIGTAMLSLIAMLIKDLLMPEIELEAFYLGAGVTFICYTLIEVWSAFYCKSATLQLYANEIINYKF